jgi:hypothetical protein
MVHWYWYSTADIIFANTTTSEKRNISTKEMCIGHRGLCHDDRNAAIPITYPKPHIGERGEGEVEETLPLHVQFGVSHKGHVRE